MSNAKARYEAVAEKLFRDQNGNCYFCSVSLNMDPNERNWRFFRTTSKSNRGYGDLRIICQSCRDKKDKILEKRHKKKKMKPTNLEFFLSRMPFTVDESILLTFNQRNTYEFL